MRLCISGSCTSGKAIGFAFLQARFLLAKLNPSSTHESQYGGGEIIFTDDVSLQVIGGANANAVRSRQCEEPDAETCDLHHSTRWGAACRIEVQKSNGGTLLLI